MARSPRSAQQASATFEWTSGSVEETQAFGERLGRLLRAGDVVALRGELGSGKTTLIQGMARGLGRDPASVKSPTFVLMREYPGEIALVHIDGYRLAGATAAAWLDVERMFSPKKVTLLEWAERFEGLLPEDHLDVHLSHVSTNRRRFQVVPIGRRATDIVTQVQSAFRNPQSAISASGGNDEAPRD